MAKLPQYVDANEKNEVFNYVVIDNKQDLERLFIKENFDGLFRGVSNASYQLFSSAQREYLGKDLHLIFGDYKSFVNELINQTELINKSFIKKMLTKFGTNANQLATLSYLQHYGAPTPLLDFSMTKNIALFFASHGASHGFADGLDNYVSVYMIENNKGDLTNLRTILMAARKSINEIKESDPSVDTSRVSKELETYNQAIEFKTLICINDNDAREGEYLIGINSNANIVAQDGLFILNPSESMPLEKLYDGVTFESLRTDAADRLFFGKMHCWDIHKSLLGYISRYLDENGINELTIYPDNQKLAKSIYNKALVGCS